jgi:hypothetical protein
MLGNMEEDPKVGDPPLAELVRLHFGLPSNKDIVSSLEEKLTFSTGPCDYFLVAGDIYN